MARGIERHRSVWRAGWIVLLVGGVLFAMSWDADGDPATDNLPVVTFVASAPTVDHEEVAVPRSLVARGTDRSTPWMVWRLVSRVGLPRRRWRPLAAPARGP